MKITISLIFIFINQLHGGIKNEVIQISKNSDLIVRLMYDKGALFPKDIQYLKINNMSPRLMDALNSLVYLRDGAEVDDVQIIIIKKELDKSVVYSIAEVEGNMRLIDFKTKEKLWLNTDEFLRLIK